MGRFSNTPAAPSYYLYDSTTGMETWPRPWCQQAQGGAATGRAYAIPFRAVKTITATKIATHADTTAGVGGTLARLGICTLDSSFNGTLVARTASDATLWSVGNTEYERALDTTGGYPASWTFEAGVFYALFFIWVGSGTAPQLVGVGPRGGTAIQQVAPRMGGYVGGQADLPTSYTAASLSLSGNRPWAEFRP